jgi:PqqD family protein of HPr-rel-A system
VYHANSGDTHRLNTVGAAVLRALEQALPSADALVERVAVELGLDASETLRSQIDDMLARLADLGLAEPVDERDPEPVQERGR